MIEPRKLSLSNKVILVTGASSGIGRAACIHASKQGAKIIATGRDIKRLYETMDNLSNSGHKCIIHDFSDHQNIDALVTKIDDKIDGVVFSAGIMNRFPIRFLNYTMLDEIFSINFFSPCLLTQKLLERKKLNNGASLVYLGSISSRMAVKGLMAYAASKAALVSLAKTVAAEQSKRFIRANVLLAGEVDTPMTQNLRTESEVLLDLKKYPLSRYARASDIATSISFLLSDDSAWITGSEFIIDGGLSLT